MFRCPIEAFDALVFFTYRLIGFDATVSKFSAGGDDQMRPIDVDARRLDLFERGFRLRTFIGIRGLQLGYFTLPP